MVQNNSTTASTHSNAIDPILIQDQTASFRDRFPPSNLIQQANSIKIVSAACGSGKTHALIDYLGKHEANENHLIALPSRLLAHTDKKVKAIDADTKTKIFTDGVCTPNPGEAGTGIAVYRDNTLQELWYGLYNENGTNNSAGLNGLYQALIMSEGEIKQGRSVEILCDSTYAIRCITKWAYKWRNNGWKKRGREEINNLELIQQTFSLYLSLKDNIEITHVKAHSGAEGNELADRMVVLAIGVQDTDFNLYRGELDIPAILAMDIDLPCLSSSSI